MKNFFTNHKYAIIAVFTAILAFCCLGCEPHASMVDPLATTTQPAMKSYTIDQLNQLVAFKQGDFDRQAAALVAQRDAVAGQLAAASQALADAKTAVAAAASIEQKAAADAQLASANAAQSAATVAAARIKSDVAAQGAMIDAFNAQTDAAFNELAAKGARQTAIVNAVGNIIKNPADAEDPVKLAVTGLGVMAALLGVGSTADSFAKSRIINRLQSQTAAPANVPDLPGEVGNTLTLN